MRQTNRTGLALAALAWIALAATGTRAADYPDRPVRVVVPFAAAGVTDVVARVVFEHISQVTGKTFVVDNRPGAGGTIAVGQVASSDPDGYTLVMADPSGSLPANVTLYPDLKYDPRKDLAPIAIFGETGAMLVVNNQLPVKTAADLVALGKSKPGELTYASTGIGTPGHLNGALFSKLAGIQDRARALSRGRTSGHRSHRRPHLVLDLADPDHAAAGPTGPVRALAVAGDERSSDLPGVPTMRETGIGDFDASTTYAIFAPVGTPHGELSTGFAARSKTRLTTRRRATKLHAAGVQPKYGAPDDITRMLRCANSAMGRCDQERRHPIN